MAKKIGTVTHLYGKISVVILELDNALKVGDTLEFQTKDGGLSQKVDSIQIEHEQVEKAKKGDAIGLKVSAEVLESVREGDEAFLAEA
ncbi:MAG: hypothetical protein AB1721_01765 [Patescibacteria group bacterium]